MRSFDPCKDHKSGIILLTGPLKYIAKVQYIMYDALYPCFHWVLLACRLLLDARDLKKTPLLSP